MRIPGSPSREQPASANNNAGRTAVAKAILVAISLRRLRQATRIVVESRTKVPPSAMHALHDESLRRVNLGSCSYNLRRPSTRLVRGRYLSSCRALDRSATRLANTAGLFGIIDYVGLGMHGGADPFDQLAHGRLLAAADVDYLLVYVGSCGGAHQRIYDIVDIDKVACLLAIAKDHDRTAAQDLVHEQRNDRRVRRRQLLARAVGVKDTQRHRFEAFQATDRKQIPFGRQLAHGIGNGGVRRQIFGNRLGFLVAVHSRRCWRKSPA